LLVQVCRAGLHDRIATGFGGFVSRVRGATDHRDLMLAASLRQPGLGAPKADAAEATAILFDCNRGNGLVFGFPASRAAEAACACPRGPY
jgi:hypothetical protein